MICFAQSNHTIWSERTEYKGMVYGYGPNNSTERLERIIINKSRRYIVELDYTRKEHTRHIIKPLEKKLELTSKTMKDSLAHFYLIDLKENMLHVFDSNQKHVASDSLKNKKTGIFFEIYPGEEREKFRKAMREMKVCGERDTVIHDKKYLAVELKFKTAIPKVNFSQKVYINDSFSRDFPLYDDDILAKGYRGVNSGASLLVNGKLDHEFILLFDDHLPKEYEVIFDQLVDTVEVVKT